MTLGTDSPFHPDRPPAQASWWWRRHDAAGAEVSPEEGPADRPRFTSQSDAETWLGETWRELLEGGVDSVTLVDGDRDVYGPMSLRPAD